MILLASWNQPYLKRLSAHWPVDMSAVDQMPNIRLVMGSIYFYKYNLSRLISDLYLRELTIGRVKEMSMNSVNMPRIFSELFLPQDVGEATCRWSLPEALKTRSTSKIQPKEKCGFFLETPLRTQIENHFPLSSGPVVLPALLGHPCTQVYLRQRREMARIGSGHPYSPLSNP